MDEHMEVLESTGAYALAEAGQEYVVYERSRPGDPLGRFPGDEEGLAQAEQLYRSLTAPYRRQRYRTGFLVLFFGALLVHVLSVTLLYLLQASQESSFESSSTLTLVVERWASAAANISNAIWIAALADGWNLAGSTGLLKRNPGCLASIAAQALYFIV